MELCGLGHAMWLVEAAGLRLLCDPLLGDTHHGGVFEVVPRRTIDAAALRPDFVLVSHRHPDHFDVPSLHRLAQLDADSVVVTPDELVAWAARRLGFAEVRVVGPGTHVQLDGLQLVTTPSLAADEWGVMIESDAGVAWNLVDTVLTDAAHVQRVRNEALAALGRVQVDLALVRWQPMLEIAAPLGHATSFPYEGYADLLDQVASIGARAIVPSACGGAHTEVYGWMDHFVYPVSPSRFLRDIGELAPDVDAFPSSIGARYRIEPSGVAFEPEGAASLATVTDDVDPRDYRPLEIPPLVDPDLGARDEATMRAEVQRWIEGALADALAGAWPRLGADRPLSLVVDVRFARAADAYTLRVGPAGTTVERGFDEDWDALNAIAGSLLWEVIDGRRHWGDVILTGAYRAHTRAYALGAGGLRPTRLGETFLYYALPYDVSVDRAVRWEVERLVGAKSRL